MLFGEDNDTAGGSDNEADGVAYGSTLYAGGVIDWQTRIRTWFRTEFIGWPLYGVVYFRNKIIYILTRFVVVNYWRNITSQR
jgi:hypothetical protein